MESRVEEAVRLYNEGYGCAQSVFAAYADLFGIDREQALRLASPFGGGIAGTRQICGTVSAMSMLTGLYNGTTTPADKQGKKINFDTARLLLDGFKEQNGSVRCGQLLGLEPGMTEGKTRKPCSEYVRSSAILVEKYLLNEK